MKHKIVNLHNETVGAYHTTHALWQTSFHQQAVYDAIVAQQASLRQGTHQVKNRAAVRGGGRKPYAQKGTGRARQGSIRAPHYRGGGTVFGPSTRRNYQRRVNKKVYNLAMRSLLADKLKTNRVIIVDQWHLKTISTKQAGAILKRFDLRGRRVLLVTDTPNQFIMKSFRNIPQVVVMTPPDLSALPLLHNDVILVSQQVMHNIEHRYCS